MAAPTASLGKNGPKVPALGFGLMGMSIGYGTAPSTEERFKVLDRAIELGATFWDTADMYGDNEDLVGQWFKRTGKRDQIFICTKFGLNRANPMSPPNSSPEYCKESCASSLSRLGVESIDLYYLHMPNPDTPIEATMRAMAELKAEGKIKNIGLSNVSANDVRRAAKVVPIAALQLEYSPFVLDIEGPKAQNLLAVARELGIAVVCYAPMGRGMVSSTYAANEASTDPGDHRGKMLPRFMEENKAKNAQLMKEFQALAERKNCNANQLALAWLMKQGNDVIPIPGTKRIKYLEDNWAALKVQLSDQDEKEIRAFLEKAEIAGDTMPPGMEGHKTRETVKES